MKKLILNLILGWLCGMIFGCANITDPVMGARYVPTNAYRASTSLPDHLRRVVVLPVTSRAVSDEDSTAMPIEVLQTELRKVKAFDLIFATREEYRSLVGRDWRGLDETIPADFFDRLRQKYHCDGVLFCELTEFHAFPPLRAGWKLRLQDAVTLETWWALDEVVDCTDPTVVAGARRYNQQVLGEKPPYSDSRTILYQPRRFAQYTAYTLLQTLQPR